MFNALSKAKGLAENIRFTGDTPEPGVMENVSHSNVVKDFAYVNELLLSKDVTPYLYDSLSTVCDSLNISQHAVEAFVYASPMIQAECHAGDEAGCIVRFSSALIDILDSNEFKFVAGHEIGHFLLSHGLARAERDNQCLEFMMQQRAQEISADRVGLLACGSLNVAIKALMKTISGLSGNHLRFDVGTFLSQLQKASDNSVHIHNNSTHPSILIRCRALLWFSLNDCFINDSSDISVSHLTNIDKKIQSDIDKHIDGAAKKRIHEVKEDLAMWMAAHDIVQDGIFTKNEQVKFSNRFGEDTLERLLNYLNDIPNPEIGIAVYERLKIAQEDLKLLIPTSYESEVAGIDKWDA